MSNNYVEKEANVSIWICSQLLVKLSLSVFLRVGKYYVNEILESLSNHIRKYLLLLINRNLRETYNNCLGVIQ